MLHTKIVDTKKEKIKIMDDFINKNKSKFKDENLKFSSKLKKVKEINWKLNWNCLEQVEI